MTRASAAPPPNSATRQLRACLAPCRNARPGARSEQALARVNSGDLEGAAQSLRPVLDLAPEQRIGGVVTSVMRVHEALRNPDYRSVPLAHDTQQEIETYSQVGAVAALPRGR